MTLPLPRSDWDYEHFDAHKILLPERARQLLVGLRTGSICAVSSCKDNRPQHQFFFDGLTPEGHGYFAGHYRGEDFWGLKDYQVGIRADSRVGVHSSLVARSMSYMSGEIEATIFALKKAHEAPASQLGPVDRLMYVVRAACKYFVEFLRVHPYANGNGHMGRFLIFSFLGIFGIWPKKWPLNDRPPDPPYSALIKAYRDGFYEGLEQFVLRCVIGEI